MEDTEINPRAEFKKRGDLKFLKWHNERLAISDFYAVTTSLFKNSYRKEIHATVKKLVSRLKRYGVGNDDQLFPLLGNMAELFSGKIDLAGLPGKDLDGKIIIWPYIQPNYNRQSLPRLAAVKGGRPIQSLALYYFVPGLVLYTQLRWGTPQWAIIRRLIEEEAEIKRAEWKAHIEKTTHSQKQLSSKNIPGYDSMLLPGHREKMLERVGQAEIVFAFDNVQSWWNGSIKGMQKEDFECLDSGRQRALYDSVFSYLSWSTKKRRAKRNGVTGLLVLNKEEKEYCGLVNKLCPFLSHALPAWGD